MAGSPGVETGDEVVAGLTREQLHDMQYHLLLTRHLEQALTNLYRQSKIVGGLYRSLGQEGTAVGSGYALRRRTDGTGDVVSPAIRDMGCLLLMHAPPVDVLRQYMAKGSSPTRGRENTVHFTDYDKGYIGLISHLGVMVEVMAGVALSFKKRGEDRVALVYSGDGMTSTGAFHEGFNFAAVQRAPLIVIVENNCYAYSTPTRKQTGCATFIDKAPGYGVYGEKCDGNDVLAVYEMTRRAVDRARAGEGAALLEVETYRMKGHAEHDGQAYIPDGELAEWEAKDPIRRFEARLLEEGWASREELDALDARAREVVDQAREEAEASPMPEPEWALGDTYGDVEDRPHWTRLPNPDPHLA